MAEIFLVSEAYIMSQLPDRSGDDITKLRKRVNDLIADYLRTSFEVLPYTEVLDSKEILVPQHVPIVSVTSLIDLSTLEEVFAEDVDYFVYPDYVYIPGRLSGNKDIQITYTAGLSSVKPLMEVVAEDIVLFWSFKEGKKDELFFAREDMEDRSYLTRVIREEAILARLRQYQYRPSGRTNPRRLVRIGVI